MRRPGLSLPSSTVLRCARPPWGPEYLASVTHSSTASGRRPSWVFSLHRSSFLIPSLLLLRVASHVNRLLSHLCLRVRWANPPKQGFLSSY